MSEMPDNVVSLTQQGRPTEQAVKDDAFRLWIELGRSWRLVSQRLNVPERTVYRWGETERWEERRVQQAASLMPGLLTETVFSLKLAAHNAGVRLQQIAYDALQGLEPNEKEVKALTAIVDRGGYSPVGKGQMPATTFHTNARPLAEMTDEELADLEATIGSGRHNT